MSRVHKQISDAIEELSSNPADNRLLEDETFEERAIRISRDHNLSKAMGEHVARIEIQMERNLERRRSRVQGDHQE